MHNDAHQMNTFKVWKAVREIREMYKISEKRTHKEVLELGLVSVSDLTRDKTDRQTQRKAY